ncbi:hypothetical protein FSP39_016498 [Pinctada imbricata]|uniref:Chitin-binding type-4 domain-containing protein n=1 Tax=Pinctada imbricata TaxID=66713 RepID=A0AA88XV06_PINIB|nr:hypothetical protein FSP39_016498 [Pinctada imbricata]
MLVYVFGLVLVVNFRESYQHGYLEKPPQRSSLWRYGYDTPPNYTDNELYCGGIDALKLAEGKCGPCGDPYIGVRQHEAGGKFASGIIVERLPFGAKELDAIVKECLDKTPLRIKEGSPEYDYFRYYPEEPWNRKDGDRYKLKVQLPTKLICSQCVLQWTYITGNSWGTNKDGASCLGCGIQEEFRNCADISIGDNNIPKEKNANPRMKKLCGRHSFETKYDVDVHANSRDTVTEVPRLHTLIPPSFLKNKFEIEKKLLERFRQRQAISVQKKSFIHVR